MSSKNTGNSSNEPKPSSSQSGKRKLEEIQDDGEQEEFSSDDDDKLFIPQAREVLGQVRRPAEPEIPEIVSTDDEENSDNWQTEDDADDGSDLDEQPNEENGEQDQQESEKEEEVEEEEEAGETMEELAAGREEKEEDEVVLAMSSASQPPERKKPRDLRCKYMITDISFHPEEDIIAFSDMNGEVSCYRYGIEQNELLHNSKVHKKPCRALTYNHNGALLFSSSKDHSIVISDSETMVATTRLTEAHDSAIYSLLCMDENIWASGDDDGVVKIWDTRRSQPKPVMEFRNIDEYVSCMVTDSAAKLLVCTSGEGTLTAYNTRTKKMEGQSEVYPAEMNCLALMRQDTKILTGLGNGMMYIFDWDSFGYHSDAFGDHPSAVNCVLPVTDNYAITGCDDGKLRAISLFPHRFLGVVGSHRMAVEHLDISTCGEFVASSSHDQRVRFWEINYFGDPEIMAEKAAKKSVRNKKRSMRKEKLGHQLPSSKRRNKGDFFAGLADPSNPNND